MAAQYTAAGVLLHRHTTMLLEIPIRSMKTSGTKPSNVGYNHVAARKWVRVKYTAMQQPMSANTIQNASANKQAQDRNLTQDSVVSHLDDVYPGEQ